jgi:hypothetical protein
MKPARCWPSPDSRSCNPHPIERSDETTNDNHWLAVMMLQSTPDRRLGETVTWPPLRLVRIRCNPHPVGRSDELRSDALGFPSRRSCNPHPVERSDEPIRGDAIDVGEAIAIHIRTVRSDESFSKEWTYTSLNCALQSTSDREIG